MVESDPPPPLGTSVQISPSKLSEIKESYLASSTLAPSLSSGSDARPSGASVLWDKPYLSSLKESFQASIQSSQIPGTAEGSDEPVNEINLPLEGPGALKPPGQSGGDDDGSDGGSSSLEISPSKPQDTDGQDTSEAANVIEGASGSQGSAGGSDESTTEGGFVNAVVGGIADGLGFGTGNGDNPVSGLNVDLGPVLDAVATLLRGPIRSAIENRRSEAQQRSDDAGGGGGQFFVPSQTQRAVLPSVSMLPAKDPNYIPVGGFGRTSPDQRQSESRNKYGYIPFKPDQQEPRQASIPLALRAEPRIDIDGDVLQAPREFIRYGQLVIIF